MTHLLCHPAAFSNAPALPSEQSQHDNVGLSASGFVDPVNVKEEILPTVKKLLSSVVNSPLQCQINDLPL